MGNFIETLYKLVPNIPALLALEYWLHTMAQDIQNSTFYGSNHEIIFLIH